MAVLIERFGNRIYLKSPYSPETRDRCKLIPGASWLADKKVWSYPLDLAVCKAMRKQFGDALRIGAELNAWAKEEIKVAKGQEELGASTTAKLSHLPAFAPNLAAAMNNRPYQNVAAAFAAGAKEGILNADQPGLGKTLEILGGIIERGLRGPVLIFCPKTAIETVWYDEIKTRLYGSKVEVAMAKGDAKSRHGIIAEFMLRVQQKPSSLHFLICNIEMARIRAIGQGADKYKHASYPELFQYAWSAIVVDESHRALIRGTGGDSQQRLGFVNLSIEEGGLKIAASGTPMRGKVENLWGTLNWLRPDLYTSRWRWIETYFHVEDNGFGKKILGIRSDAEEDFANSLKGIMIRRTKDEVLPDLPRKQYAGTRLDPGDESSPVGIWLPMEGEQRRIYEAMERDATVQLDSGELDATGVLAEMTRLKQFASAHGDIDDNGVFHPKLPSNKFDWISEFLYERGITGKEEDAGGTDKVVIVSQYTSLLNEFSKEFSRLGIKHFMLTGETKDKQRAAYRNEFQDEQNETRVFLLNVKAGGVAITLDAADDMIFIDETWIPDDQEQAEDRIHRASRMHKTQYWYLRSLESIEEGIAYVTGGREDAQKRMMDGSRGVEFAREIIEAGKARRRKAKE